MKQGFLHIASAVPTSLVRHARRVINHSLGAGIDRRDVVRINARSFCEELVEDPRLLRLATKPRAWSYVRSLVGDRRVERPQGVPDRPALSTARRNAPHVRCSTPGRLPHAVQRPSGRRCRDGFTLLLGVMLSDVDEPLSGNFTVWPGTHLRLEQHFRDHGVQSLERGDVTTSGIRLPRPVPITGKSGEVGRNRPRPLPARPRRIAEPVR